MCDHAAPPLPALTPMRTRSFPGQHSQIRQARHFIAAFLHGCPAAADAVLLASELCANAVTHSASGQPGGTFTLRAQAARDGRVHVEVEDQGSSWNGNIHAATSPHGLFLLQQLAAGYGTRRAEHGWITWFTIASAPASRNAPRP